MPKCPAGHDSATSDYCDVCGAVIDGAEQTPSLGVTPGRSGASPVCPDCGTPQTGRFCEECGFDLISGTTATTAPGSRSNAGAIPGHGQTGPWARTWTAVANADRKYFEMTQGKGGPEVAEIEFPTFCPERRFPLDRSQVRIGRRSVSRGIAPEIDLTGPPQDPGISHLHALLLARSDGTWALVDLGSTNGTYMNSRTEPVEHNVLIPLREGDEIHVGAWTTIKIQAD
jgi:hypothetical protein